MAPHKCARDAEISEEVINRTKPRKRGGKRKQTEEVTGTCRVKARPWERDRERERLTDYFSRFYCREKACSAAVFTVLAVCLAAFFSLLPVSWPLNSWWWVCLPVVCSPNWSQDGDALAAWEQYSIYIHLLFEIEPTQRREDELKEVSVGGKVKKKRCEDWRVGSFGLFTLAGIFPCIHCSWVGFPRNGAEHPLS